MRRSFDIGADFPSPRRGEGGARSASGEGVRRLRICRTPSPNPLPAGERALEAVTREEQFLADGFEDSFGVLQDVIVPETDDAVAKGFDDRCARHVDGFAMLSTVQFNRKMRVAAGEVRYVWANRKLPDEFGAFQLAGAEVAPEALLGVRASDAQFSCNWRQAFFRQRRSPSPQPSPRRGEGAIAERHPNA